MGIGREMQEDSKADYYIALGRAEDGVWITKDGSELAISDMGTKHLENCIRMLEAKSDRISKTYYDLMTEELERRNTISSFKPGQLIIYKNGDKYEIGKIKRITDNGAFVWYHSGETAAKTRFEDMIPIVNERCIVKTTLGGSDVDPRPEPVREYLPGVPEDSMAAHFLSSVEPDEEMGGW